MANKIGFNLSFSNLPKAVPRSPEDPLKILIIGNFSGSDTGVTQPRRVNIDNLDSVFQEIRPSLAADADSAIVLRFESIEELHPDALLKQLPQAQELLEMRRRLGRADSFEQAAAELLPLAEQSDHTESDPVDEAGSDKSDFSSLLGQATTNPGERSKHKERSRADTVIADIVRPHIVKDNSDRQAALISAVDDSLTEVLREILADPAYRTIESNWLGLQSLVQAVYDDEIVQLYLCNTKVLASESAESFAEHLSALAEAIAPKTGDAPWSLILACEYFGNSDADLNPLAELGNLARNLNATVLAGAAPALFGLASYESPALSKPGQTDPTLQESWENLRSLESAASIGLAAPRFLVRQPYGKNSNEIDTFEFEELRPRPDHESFPWGNPALLIGRIVVMAFQEDGWNFSASLAQDVGDIPLAIYNDGSGQAIKPGAECLLTEKNVHQMLGQGVMPLLSHRNQNTIRLGAFVSASAAGCAPAGLMNRDIS